MIQYPKNTHTTLPSVEGGFGTMNILRDPPKSVYTRYIPKVGDTSKITEWIDSPETANRICEVIKPYARGVNPMVSVSYSNYGANGGQQPMTVGATADHTRMDSANQQARLPYRIMRDGVFRPPVPTQRELMPLSRQPRIWTAQQTNPNTNLVEFDAFSRDMQCNSNMRAIRSELLNVCAPPRPSFHLEQSASEPPMEVRYHITSKPQTSATTNPQAKAFTLQTNQTPHTGIQDGRYATVVSKPCQNIQVTSIDQCLGNQTIPVHETMLRGSVQSNIKQVGEHQYINDEDTIHLDRNRPLTHATTNTSRQIDLNQQVQSRTYGNLRHRPSRGGFQNSGVRPTIQRQEQIPTRREDTMKQRSDQALRERYQR